MRVGGVTTFACLGWSTAVVRLLGLGWSTVVARLFGLGWLPVCFGAKENSSKCLLELCNS